MSARGKAKVAPAPSALASTASGGGGGARPAVTHGYLTKRREGWTFSDMLRDRKELETLAELRATLLLEQQERRQLEMHTQLASLASWLALGFIHGGHWLYLSARLKDPRLAYVEAFAPAHPRHPRAPRLAQRPG